MTSRAPRRTVNALSEVRIPIASIEPDVPFQHGHLCIVLIDGTYHAVDDRCSHEDVSLAEGERIDVEDCAIECWKHGSVFSLLTGEALNPPAIYPLKVHAAWVEGDEVVVTM